MKIPKRPGQKEADEIARLRREATADYYDSLKYKDFEVIESRLLKLENVPYRAFWNGGYWVIKI